jgi:hypothetical protein
VGTPLWLKVVVCVWCVWCVWCEWLCAYHTYVCTHVCMYVHTHRHTHRHTDTHTHTHAHAHTKHTHTHTHTQIVPHNAKKAGETAEVCLLRCGEDAACSVLSTPCLGKRTPSTGSRTGCVGVEFDASGEARVAHLEADISQQSSMQRFYMVTVLER